MYYLPSGDKMNFPSIIFEYLRVMVKKLEMDLII